jgi:hypothetical protein
MVSICLLCHAVNNCCHAITSDDYAGIWAYMRVNGFARIERFPMFSLLISRPLASAIAAMHALGDYFNGLFAIVQEAHANAARFELLAQMSDAELARHGLKREGLAQAVFTALEA